MIVSLMDKSKSMGFFANSQSCYVGAHLAGRVVRQPPLQVRGVEAGCEAATLQGAQRRWGTGSGADDVVESGLQGGVVLVSPLMLPMTMP